MTPSLLLVCAAVTLGSAAWLLQPPNAVARSRASLPVSGQGLESHMNPTRRWLPLMAELSAGCAAAVFIGGFVGLVVGVMLAWGVHRWLSNLPRAEQVARQRRTQAELPMVTELLGSCLASGASGASALRAVGDTANSDLRGQLRQVLAALEMGAAPHEAWATVEGTELETIAAVMHRSATTGAPAAYLLSELGRDQRAERRLNALSEVRRLGVRSAGPLGLCFLPAFIVIGVVPLVLSLVQAWT